MTPRLWRPAMVFGQPTEEAFFFDPLEVPVAPSLVLVLKVQVLIFLALELTIYLQIGQEPIIDSYLHSFRMKIYRPELLA